MPKPLQEFTTSRGIKVKVNPDAGVIHGVKVIGLDSLNHRRYLPAALQQAAPLYDKTKVNINHPKGDPLSPRDYQDRIGTLRNVQFRPGEGLFADFHFNPRHAMAEQLVWDAQNAPENVGFSHNVLARTTNHDGPMVVHEITRVQSVDLVADPATTRGLFEASRLSEPSTESESVDRAESKSGQPTDQPADLTEPLRSQLIESIRLQLAPHLEQLQKLIEQQSQLIEKLGSKTEIPLEHSTHILSREQTMIEPTPVPSDSAAFAKAISI